jgi:ribosomal protein S18 acetylase RimI-like enzyme
MTAQRHRQQPRAPQRLAPVAEDPERTLFCDNCAVELDKSSHFRCAHCPDTHACSVCVLHSRGAQRGGASVGGVQHERGHLFLHLRQPQHPGILVSAPLPPAEPASDVHDDIVCDGCDGAVVGRRWKCAQCEDFDLCDACYATADHRLKHAFFLVPLSLARFAGRPSLKLAPLYVEEPPERLDHTKAGDEGALIAVNSPSLAELMRPFLPPPRAAGPVSISVCPFESDMCAEVMRIEKQAFGRLAWARDYVEEWAAGPRNRLLVAVDECSAQIAGFVMASLFPLDAFLDMPDKSDDGEHKRGPDDSPDLDGKCIAVSSLAVDARFRGYGVGERLLRYVVAEIAPAFQGVRDVFLQVSVRNRVAQGLYAKLGFERVRMIPGYYRRKGDAWLMRKRLSA